MNCEKAREIIDITLNGEGHPLAESATAHLRDCEFCREWQADMSRTIDVLASLPEPPVPDIAAMVMTKLPAAHPASLRAEPNKAPLFRALAWVGAGWLMVILLALMVVAGSQWLGLNSLGSLFGFGEAIAGAFGSIAAAGKTIWITARDNSIALARTSIDLGVPLLWFLLLDSAALAAILVIWRRRGRAVNACFMSLA